MARYDFSTYRLFVEAPLAAGSAIPLLAGQMHYLLNVLRMDAGAHLRVFNGREGEWRATLEMPTRKTALLRVETQTRPQEPLGRITYAFAPIKTPRMDYIIEKSVEMGASVLQPVLTARTQGGRLRADKLQAHIVEAAEQCGLLALPVLRSEIPLETLLANLPPDHLLVFADEDAPILDPIAALRQRGSSGTACTLLVGPEGGFTPNERARILALPQCCRISLGPRILRADTAAIAALALVEAAFGP